MSAEYERLVTADELVKVARSLMGARFAHAGRARGGVDCIGLVVLPCQALGIRINDEKLYSRQPHPQYFLRRLREEVNELPKEEPVRAGLVAFFWIQHPRMLRHIGLFTSPTSMIHSFSDATEPTGGSRSSTVRHVGKVYEIPYGKYWRDRLAHLFEIPGVL